MKEQEKFSKLNFQKRTGNPSFYNVSSQDFEDPSFNELNENYLVDEEIQDYLEDVHEQQNFEEQILQAEEEQEEIQDEQQNEEVQYQHEYINSRHETLAVFLRHYHAKCKLTST